jgi:hypothetical protein
VNGNGILRPDNAHDLADSHEALHVIGLLGAVAGLVYLLTRETGGSPPSGGQVATETTSTTVVSGGGCQICCAS